MIYVYDILVNFSEYLYDFYEWNKKDNILHIKKIPLIRVDAKAMNDIYHYHTKFSEDFLEEIRLQTEKYDFKKIQYAAIFSDGEHALVLELTNEGEVKYRSRLLLDDEEEVTGYVRKAEEKIIPYQKISKWNLSPSLTRKENRIRDLLLKNIKLSYKKQEYQKIEYLYLEYFNCKKEDVSVMYQELLDSILNHFSDKHLNLYQVLLLETKKSI